MINELVALVTPAWRSSRFTWRFALLREGVPAWREGFEVSGPTFIPAFFGEFLDYAFPRGYRYQSTFLSYGSVRKIGLIHLFKMMGAPAHVHHYQKAIFDLYKSPDLNMIKPC